MAIVKQTILLNVVYEEEDIHSGNAADAIDHSLFNEEGVYRWDYKVLNETKLDANITEEDVVLSQIYGDEANKHENGEGKTYTINSAKEVFDLLD